MGAGEGGEEGQGLPEPYSDWLEFLHQNARKKLYYTTYTYHFVLVSWGAGKVPDEDGQLRMSLVA